MKITVQREDLLKAVGVVSRLVTSRTTLPILQNILLKINETGLEIRSTDLEQTLEYSIKGSDIETGTVTVPAKLFLEYLQNNNDTSLTISAQDTSLELITKNSKAKIKGIAPEDYPDLPKATVINTISLPCELVLSMINQTIFSVANDDTRPVLNGLLFRFKNQILTIVGTDGYRLAKTQLKIESDFEGDYIFPKRSMLELVRIGNTKELVLEFSTSQVCFVADSIRFTTRLIEGAFPPYETIIPNQEGLKTKVINASITQGLKIASLFSRDSSYSTKLEFEGSKLLITANSPQFGETKNEVELIDNLPQKIDISLNAQYLIDVLTHVEREVLLVLTDNKSPIVIKEANDQDKLYLIMPLRSE